ncbi:MAG: TetR/AcrR family transcriptional regulator [Myxococcaceae bacterium]
METARRIVREEGTQALTLGYLAQRAGVSKPITYEHFETRSGLLVALAQQIDDRQVKVLFDALEKARPQLSDIARTLADAYIHCYQVVGSEWQAMTAALKGNEEMDAVQQALLDRYVDIYRDALAPYTALPKRELRLRCVAIVGAAEALVAAMARGSVGAAKAAQVLASLIERWIASGA